MISECEMFSLIHADIPRNGHLTANASRVVPTSPPPPVSSPLVPSTHHAQPEPLAAVLGNPQHLVGFVKNLKRNNGATEKEKKGRGVPQAGHQFMTVWMSSKQERKARRVVAATLQFPNPAPRLSGPPTQSKEFLPSSSSSLLNLPVLLPRPPPERFMEKASDSPPLLQAESHQLKGDLISKISLGKRNYP